MRRKRHLIGLLLLAYPASWRHEYGKELGALLLQTPLTPTVIWDTVLNGVRQQFRGRAELGMILSLYLLTWTAFALNWPARSASYQVFLYSYYAFWMAIHVVIFLWGTWMTLKQGSTLFAVLRVSARASFAVLTPDLLGLGRMWVWRQGNSSIVGMAGGWNPHRLDWMPAMLFRSSTPPSPLELVFGGVLILFVKSVFFGLLGGMVGRVGRRFLPRQQAELSR
jgi:hypothetical protein